MLRARLAKATPPASFQHVCEAFTLETSFLHVWKPLIIPVDSGGLGAGQACTCSTPEVPQSMYPDITTVCSRAPYLIITPRLFTDTYIRNDSNTRPSFKMVPGHPTPNDGKRGTDLFSETSPPHTVSVTPSP